MPSPVKTLYYAAGQDSYHPSGIYSYIAFNNDEKTLVCLRLGLHSVEQLFSTPLPNIMKAPISFEDCVVTVNALGDLHVYDLTGKETLRWRVPSTQGAIGQALRFGYESRRVLLVHKFYGPRSRVQKTELVVIEVPDHRKAVVRKRVQLDLDWPAGVHYVSVLPGLRSGGVLVVGENETKQIRIEIQGSASPETDPR